MAWRVSKSFPWCEHRGRLAIVLVAAACCVSGVATRADAAAGDCNGTPLDVAAVVSAVFDPTPCAAADVNGDQRVTAGDVVAQVRVETEPAVTPSATGSPSRTPTVTQTATITETGTQTGTPSRTPTGTMTGTPTRTPTSTPSPSATVTPSPPPTSTPTATPTPSPTPTNFGAQVVYVGALNYTSEGGSVPDGGLVCASFCCDSFCVAMPTPTPAYDPQGRQIFEIEHGGGFVLVVEGGIGASGAVPGSSLMPGLGSRPDLQIENNRDLGAGTQAICDTGFTGGGVPGVNPPDFSPDNNFVTDALNDFACRFESQLGFPGATGPCTMIDTTHDAATVSRSAKVQFCDHVASESAFHSGDNIVTVRLRDVNGNLGPPAQIVVRVP